MFLSTVIGSGNLADPNLPLRLDSSKAEPPSGWVGKESLTFGTANLSSVDSFLFQFRYHGDSYG